MNILVLNRGSSTIKCYLYRYTSEKLLYPTWKALVQWKNIFENPSLTIQNERGAEYSEAIKAKNAAEALEQLLTFLVQGNTAVLHSLHEIEAAGHRLVHGGKWFSASVRITKDVKAKIRELAELAPLHNLPEYEGIELLEKLLPHAPQVAVFDTAFHHTLPQKAVVYPGPYRWYEEDIRRYGFHGISYQYCARRASTLLQDNLKMVICHLGSGASLCAVENGKSIDTTMGYTPLEGMMMDTRCGTIDPGIILHLLEKKNMQPGEISDELYKESGLLGVSGISSDMREIIERMRKGEPRAVLAFDVYVHRLNALIGSMIAALGGLDALIFTAGIGENAPFVRKRVCEAFSFLGLKLDPKQNEHEHLEDAVLSFPDSKVHVLLIHTQEAFEIARECRKVLDEESV